MKFLKCLHSWPRGFRAPFRSRRSAAGGLPGGAELRGPPAAFRAGDGVRGGLGRRADVVCFPPQGRPAVHHGHAPDPAAGRGAVLPPAGGDAPGGRGKLLARGAPPCGRPGGQQGSGVREAAGDAVAARGSASGLGAARCAGGVCTAPPTPRASGTLRGGPGTGSAHAAAFTR